jgi:type IV pilus assembly protein PilA
MKNNSSQPGVVLNDRLLNTPQGFLLAELMIVIAIIAIIAAIAIPNLLRARAAANEASAIGSCMTIVSSQEMFYQGDYNHNVSYDYATSTQELRDSGILIDNVLGTGQKHGYQFDMTSETADTWKMIATPASPLAGEHNFYVDQKGRIFFTVCGNGIKEPGEDCDPGDWDTMNKCETGESCNNNCQCTSDNPAPFGPTSMLALRSYYESELSNKGSSFISDLLELAPATAVDSAIKMLTSPQTVRQIIRLLDQNSDGKLSFNEITTARILTLAKIIAKSCPIKGPDLNIDEVQMEAMLNDYQNAIMNAMEFDPKDQEPPPLISAKNLSVEPAILFLQHFPANQFNDAK